MSTSEDRTSSIFSVHCTEGGSQSTFFRATLRLRTWVRRRWVFERSQRIFATELPTVPKPRRATLQFCATWFFAPTASLLPVALRLEGPVIVPLSSKRNVGCVLAPNSNPRSRPKAGGLRSYQGPFSRWRCWPSARPGWPSTRLAPKRRARTWGTLLFVMKRGQASECRSADARGGERPVCPRVSWDAEGKALTIDTVSLTYDALGRMVEQNRSGSYTQIVYGPNGGKLALMNGPTLQKAFVGLTGGATAVYTASGLDHYRHGDWLGSSRLATTPSRTMSFDVAYAPYGEDYADSGTADLSFTGQNQDTISATGGQGLYDFLYREYAPVQGRWISPDPAGLGATNPMNPQSWNRYAYVANNPLGSVDPLGLRLSCNQNGECVYHSCNDTTQFCRQSFMGIPDLQLLGIPSYVANSLYWSDGGWHGVWAGFLMVGGDDGGGQQAANNCVPGTKGCFNVPQLCANVPKSPPGASATFNANLVSQETQGMWPATKLDYFYQVFATGGTFDYKAGGNDQYVDYGN